MSLFPVGNGKPDIKHEKERGIKQHKLVCQDGSVQGSWLLWFSVCLAVPANLPRGTLILPPPSAVVTHNPSSGRGAFRTPHRRRPGG